MVRTNQGGSILGFVVIGGIMALLLVGGAFAIRHNLAPAKKQPEVAVTNNQDESTNQDQSETAKEDTNKDNQITLPGSDGSDAPKSSQNVTPTEKSPSTSTPVSTGLPKTGPSGSLLGGVMLSIMTGLLLAYRQSRRLRTSL